MHLWPDVFTVKTAAAAAAAPRHADVVMNGSLNGGSSSNVDVEMGNSS